MPTVFDTAHQWARDHFKRLEGQPYEVKDLRDRLQKGLADFPGLERKKWLFVYSPGSANPFFEVAGEPIRLEMALTKLVTIASEGGMILGADFSENWGTRKCVPKYVLLAVCKSTSGTAPHMTITELARELKKRQQKTLPKKLLRSISAEDMVWSYLTCSECQQPFVTDYGPVIHAVDSVEAFVAACNILIAIHRSEAHGETIYQGDHEVTVDELRNQLPSSVVSALTPHGRGT